jgi:hypothetical protein
MGRATVHKTKSKDPPVPAWVIRVCKLGLPKFRVTSGTKSVGVVSGQELYFLVETISFFVFYFPISTFHSICICNIVCVTFLLLSKFRCY